LLNTYILLEKAASALEKAIHVQNPVASYGILVYYSTSDHEAREALQLLLQLQTLVIPTQFQHTAQPAAVQHSIRRERLWVSFLQPGSHRFGSGLRLRLLNKAGKELQYIVFGAQLFYFVADQNLQF